MTDASASSRPTVALVHGAFADSSSWNGGSRCLSGSSDRNLAADAQAKGCSADEVKSLFTAEPKWNTRASADGKTPDASIEKNSLRSFDSATLRSG